MKNKTAIRQFGSAKSRHNEIKAGTIPWALKPKRKINSKIKNQINKFLYNWIMHHPQVVQSQIFNDFLKVNIDGHTELQLFPKL